MRTIGMAAVAALALACGSGRSGGGTDTGTPGDGWTGVGGGGGGGGGAAPCDGQVTVRLKGFGPAGVERFVVNAWLTSISAGGVAVPFVLDSPQPAADLLLADSYRLAVVAPAPDAGTVRAAIAVGAVDAVVRFAPEDAQGAPVTLDACATPIAFTFEPAKIDPARCHVVVELDLRGSAANAFGPDGAWAPVFLPRFRVVY